MAIIVLNPDNGASIKGWNFEGIVYFEDKPFAPGNIWKFEDELTGQKILETYGFLEEISVSRAKKFLATTLLKCEQCSFETRTPEDMPKHMVKHKAEAELDDLGIPVMKKPRSIKDKLDEETRRIDNKMQQDIDSQAKDAGLDIGEGLVSDRSLGV